MKRIQRTRFISGTTGKTEYDTKGGFLNKSIDTPLSSIQKTGFRDCNSKKQTRRDNEQEVIGTNEERNIRNSKRVTVRGNEEVKVSDSKEVKVSNSKEVKVSNSKEVKVRTNKEVIVESKIQTLRMYLRLIGNVLNPLGVSFDSHLMRKDMNMPKGTRNTLGHLKKAVSLHNKLRSKNPTVSKKESESEASVLNKIIILLNEVDQELDRLGGGSK